MRALSLTASMNSLFIGRVEWARVLAGCALNGVELGAKLDSHWRPIEAIRRERAPCAASCRLQVLVLVLVRIKSGRLRATVETGHRSGFGPPSRTRRERAF